MELEDYLNLINKTLLNKRNIHYSKYSNTYDYLKYVDINDFEIETNSGFKIGISVNKNNIKNLKSIKYLWKEIDWVLFSPYNMNSETKNILYSCSTNIKQYKNFLTEENEIYGGTINISFMNTIINKNGGIIKVI